VVRFLICLLLLSPLPALGDADPLRPEHPGLSSAVASFKEMVGQNLLYDISFLWFDRLAKGTFSLEPTEKPDTYRAVIEARTLGVAAWLTQDRKQRYVSIMELGADGRLRSLRFESHIIRRKGGKVIDRTKRFVFDHANREVRIEKLADDQTLWQEVLPMEGEVPPDDLITAYFNFRGGFYGAIEPGRQYLVPTFNRKGAGNIGIELFTESQRPALESIPAGGLLARLTVDPEIFDTEGGNIYVWLDDRLRPAHGILENVKGLGNVYGALRH
jgi:hypothetical protein